MALGDAITAAKAARDPQQLMAAVPYARFLGLSLEVGPEGLVCRLAYNARNIGNPVLPALHGGVIGALLESTAIFHLIWEMEDASIPKTINMSIDFLTPGRPIDAFAHGTITRQGRRVANVRIEAWQEERTTWIAAAHGHFLLA